MGNPYEKKPLTWGELADIIKSVQPHQLNHTITVRIDDEYYAAKLKMSSNDNNILGPGHLFITKFQED